MIDTGYLFSNNTNRLFVNTSLGCNANCSYCYLPNLNYSKGKELNTYITAEELIKQIETYKDFKTGKNGTLISFGCYSECWDEINKPQTIKLIKYFLEKGNQIQFATKRYVDYKDLIDVSKFIKYYNQLTIFISSATISEWNKFEKGTNFQGWSSVIMKNIFINQRRRTAKIKPADTENDTSGKCSFNEKATDNTPENNLSAHEIMSKINNCPTDHCRPFRLFLAGYSYKEIADKLALPIGTVKSRIFAARKILQSALSGYK